MPFRPDPELVDLFRPSVDEGFPFPVAAVYREIFDANAPADRRQVALAFCAYQLMRTVALPLVSRHLRAGAAPARGSASAKAVDSLRRAIARTKTPSFSAWIELAHTLAKHLPRIVEPVPETDLLARFVHAMSVLSTEGSCWFDERKVFHPPDSAGQPQLQSKPLDALRCFRNALAHGGLPTRPMEQVRLHLPVLNRALEAFEYLTECRLLVREPEGALLLLRGAGQAIPVAPTDLATDTFDELEEAGVVLVAPDGAVEPLYPLFRSRIDRDHVLEYDGHFFDARQRHAVLYLGAHEHHSDSAAATRLLSLLQPHQIEWRTRRADVTPASLIDAFHDHSLRVVEELQASGRYLPSCYVPPVALLAQLETFVDQSPSSATGDLPNGLLLASSAGAGKTALLAHWVARRIRRRDSPGLDRGQVVLFVRGDLVTERAHGSHPPLARTILERAQVHQDEFPSLQAFLAHLDDNAGLDRDALRVTFVLDGLNEAARATDVVWEALDLVREAARYPWCRVILALRAEFLHALRARLDATQAWPLEVLRRIFFAPKAREGLPAIFVPPLDESQAEIVYERHRLQREHALTEGVPRSAPACNTPWQRLQPETRRLLLTPLMLRLFLECFDGQDAEPLAEPRALFRHLVTRALERRPGLENAVRCVLASLEERAALEGRPYLSDDDAGAVRAEWARDRSEHECRAQLWPVEALLVEGWLVRAEGGGFRVVFERLAEYLLFRRVAGAIPPGTDPVAHWRSFLSGPGATFPTGLNRIAFLFMEWVEGNRLAELDSLLCSPASAHVIAAFRAFMADVGRAPHLRDEPSPRLIELARYVEATTCLEVLLASLDVATDLEDVGELDHAIVLLQALAPALEARGPCARWPLGKAQARLGGVFAAVGRHDEALPMLERAVATLRAELADSTAPRRHDVTLALGTALPALGMAWLRARRDRVTVHGCFDEAITLLTPVAAGGHLDAIRALVEALVGRSDRCRLLHDYVGAEALLSRAEVTLHGLHHDEDSVSTRGTVLRQLTIVRRELSRFGDALETTDRALTLLRPHVLRRPERRHWLYLLTNALIHRGTSLLALGRHEEGRASLVEGVQRIEAYLQLHPEDVVQSNRLAQAYKALGQLLGTRGAAREACRHLTTAVSLREALVRRDRRASFRVDLAHALLEQGRLLRLLGQCGAARAALDRSILLLSEAGDRPEVVSRAVSLASARVERAQLLEELGLFPLAEQDLQWALGLLEPAWHHEPTHHETALALSRAFLHMAKVMRASARFDAALDAMRRSLGVLEGMNRDSQGASLNATLELARALTDAGQLWGRSWDSGVAEQALRRAVNLLELFVSPDPRELPEATVALAGAYRWLGHSLVERGDHAQAELALRRGYAVATIAIEVEPDQPDPRRMHAGLTLSLGTLELRHGRHAEAMGWFTAAIATLDLLARRHPELLRIHDQLARALTEAAGGAAALGQTERAKSYHREALAIREGLCAGHPDRDDWRNNLARSRTSLGGFLMNQGCFTEARHEFERALTARRELWACARANLERLHSLSILLLQFGRCLEAERDFAGAESALRESVEHLDELISLRPERSDWRPSHVQALEALAGLFLRAGRAGEGRAVRRRAEAAADAAPDSLASRGESTESWV